MSEADLIVRVQVAAELVREGATAAVIYRRWGGPTVMEEVAGQPVGSADLELTVPPPGPGVRSLLPAELGGPWPFAIGYLVVRDAPTENGESGAARVLAAAPEHRVLWVAGPFPLEAFARAVPPHPTLTVEEREQIDAGLASLPVGLSLARSRLLQRSLAGFAAVGDEVVALDPARSLEWPPRVF